MEAARRDPEAQKREGATIKNDVSVPVSKVPEFITLATAACERHFPGIRVMPFGHMGDGNIHFNVVQPVGGDGAAFLRQDPAIRTPSTKWCASSTAASRPSTASDAQVLPDGRMARRGRTGNHASNQGRARPAGHHESRQGAAALRRDHIADDI